MRRYLWLLAALSLPGCVAVGPRYEEPDPTGLQSGYIYGDRPVFAPANGAASQGAWWLAFSDERIAEAVAIAREQNRDLRAAFFRLEAAEARAGAARRALLPQGATGFSITRQEAAQAAFAGFAGAAGGSAPARENPEFTTYEAQTQASWEIDLFGRLRRQAQGARARAGQQEDLLLDTQRVVTAQTVETFILLVEALNRRRVARENLAVQRRALELTAKLVELGEAPKIDQLRQETLVKQTEAQVKQVENAAAEATAGLALLLGMTVPEFLDRFPRLVDEELAPPMPTAAGAVVLTEPDMVLRRRPDVAAAERQLAAEIYDIGVETAGLFPQVELTGSANLIALDFSGLSDDQAFGYAAGPRISWQILSYPRILKQRAAARAEASAALANYEQTVLTALTETDRALAQYVGAVEQAVFLTEAEAAARESLRLAEIRYREGADSLLTLLDAQRTALQTQDQAIQAQALALRTRTAVHRVLAD